MLKSWIHIAVVLSFFFAAVTSHADSVIGVLQSRDHMIELHAADERVLYTVKNRKGLVLAERITDTELLSEFPDLEGVIRGYADDASLGPAVGESHSFDPLD